jgi:hypothetical protein
MSGTSSLAARAFRFYLDNCPVFNEILAHDLTPGAGNGCLDHAVGDPGHLAVELRHALERGPNRIAVSPQITAGYGLTGISIQQNRLRRGGARVYAKDHLYTRPRRSIAAVLDADHMIAELAQREPCGESTGIDWLQPGRTLR